MAEIMKLVESQEIKKTDIPSFGPGDTVKVHVKVKEGDKERIQIFQGVVISRRGGGTRQMPLTQIKSLRSSSQDQ